MSKYIFVTGGVCSSLGKGIASASLGALLECRGLKVCMVKIDPYLNVDAGTMSPYQHGEVFVTDDGAETDLDLGNYQRFTYSNLTQDNSITTGQIYQSVIAKERAGKYLGKCVQVVPHITDEIKRRIYMLGEKEDIDITIVETGGTVGDIESIPYLEAIRQIIHERGRKKALSVHLTLVPEVTGGEVKTKPTQHSVKAMREIGIQPDVLLCRCKHELDMDLNKKISLFTNIDYDAVLSAHDVNTTIYEIPAIYHEQGLDRVVCQKMDIKKTRGSFSEWNKLTNRYKAAEKTLRIAMVGKYTLLGDTYKSVDEALVHGAMNNGVKLEIVKIESDQLEDKDDLTDFFKDIHGILIPGGFGDRGIRGMVDTARYARENKIPYLGICLGLQIMVIEYCRNVLGIKDADSAEFNPQGPNNVITLLEDQVDVTEYGGTMRLGGSFTHLEENTKILQAYNKEKIIKERHRHRYEVANDYKERLQEKGLVLSGFTPDAALVESVEWTNHPWGVSVQFHPEFTSTPLKPGPLFNEFVKASIKKI
ncbi:MAG: CTP synthase [Spirochaetaceae bacterium]|jgi:CTP synthase|nr:CTP synthase [Spirochaetaceae bacterium]